MEVLCLFQYFQQHINIASFPVLQLYCLCTLLVDNLLFMRIVRLITNRMYHLSPIRYDKFTMIIAVIIIDNSIMQYARNYISLLYFKIAMISFICSGSIFISQWTLLAAQKGRIASSVSAPNNDCILTYICSSRS